MRTSIAVLGSISILMVGIRAISESAQQSESAAMGAGNASADAWNMSSEMFNNIGVAGSSGIVWFGVAAIILVSLGILVTAGAGGGR